ncbi:MAG: exo-alpha-sialidase [Phycisphaerae bacterium]|nr:exo-alpha-sialidase [Phycisphaerae bacterium]
MHPSSIVQGLSVVRSKPFVIVQTDEAAGWGVLTHPYLCSLSEQRIMVTYNMVGDVLRGGTRRAMADWPAYSEDGGKTWQFGDPITWADGAPPHVTSATKGEIISFHYGYCFGQVVLSNGLRIAVERLASSGKKPGARLRQRGVWSHDGRTWHGPREVIYELADPVDYILISPRAVQLGDGNLLCVAYGPRQKGGKYDTYALRSDDGGATYQLLSVVARCEDAPWGNNGPCEPTLERLSDGSLFCMMRTGSAEGSRGRGKTWTARSSPMLSARSRDGGKSWELGRISKPGVMPGLLELSNGVLVCAFGRPGNSLMFSLDGGRTWIREMTLTAADVRTTGYVDILEVEPGRLLVVYDAWDTPPANVWLWEPPPPVCAVWGVFVDVSRRGQ